VNFPSFMHAAGAPSDVAETPDIDVTPVMNMFVILIPFLVSMAVFTQLSILELSLPPNVGAGLDDSGGKPKLKLTVVLKQRYLAITHGASMLDSIPREDGDEYDLLRERLVLRREGVEIKDQVIVAVGDEVPMGVVVRVMDRCREAGFDKTALSSTAEAKGGGS